VVRRPPLQAIALTLGLVALWSVTHSYKGLRGDAELYAVQAMATIHAGLSTDIFLQNGSQDKYTIFSPIYAWFISRLGLANAAITLWLSFEVWLFGAAWALARAVSNARMACLAVALLMIVDGAYGGYQVFRYAEDFLTARSFAEALAVSAIALHFYNFKTIGLLTAVVSLFVHPIMALPGLLMLVCLRSKPHIAVMMAGLGALFALGISLFVLRAPESAGPLAVLDPPWLDIVRERSVFLFPLQWTSADWEINGRPFLCLAVTAMALPDTRVRALCISAGLVGATGLAIAIIAGTIGHPAILLQGQAWRWMWLTCLASVLLVAPTAAAIYRDRRCGPVTALLLVLGWILPPANGIPCMALALFIWSIRERIETRSSLRLQWIAGAVGIAIVAAVVLGSWNAGFAPATGSRSGASVIAQLRDFAVPQVPVLVAALFALYWLPLTRSAALLTLIIVAFSIWAAILVPRALKDVLRDGSLTEVNAFADWRKTIPPTSNVFVAPAHYSAAFAWFTLQRPSYSSVNQSAGVIFSRATAMEIERRSQVLLPMLDPNWRLRSSGRGAPANDAVQRASRPLTKDRLLSVCSDPQLGFVVAKEDVGIGLVGRNDVGDSTSWSLYDCTQVRLAAPRT
jgi:hypothetical protein